MISMEGWEKLTAFSVIFSRKIFFIIRTRQRPIISRHDSGQRIIMEHKVQSSQKPSEVAHLFLNVTTFYREGFVQVALCLIMS